MFGLFKNKKQIQLTQLVWKNKTAKYKGLLKNLSGKENILLLYYFNDTKTELQNEIDKNSLQQRIAVEHASKLLSSFTDLSNSFICFTEHHPSFQKEHEILQHLQETCNVKEVFFYVSLDEPLFQHFGSENILSLMEKMGFGEDESLEHSMILKSVINAQKKIDEETGNNIMETSSSKDWFEMNVRKT